MSCGIFNTITTYQADFVAHKINKVKAQTPRLLDDPQKERKRQELRQKDIATMKYFQPDVYVPFDLFFRPKQCVTTNPSQEVEYESKDKSNEFAERIEARRTRPRVYMVPQISLDDVDQELMYKKNGLADNIYTSDWKMATEFTKDFANKFVSNVQPSYKPQSVNLKPEEFCTPIEPGMQRYSHDWDRFQIRANVDPKNLYWKKNPELGKCSVCTPTAEDKLTEEEHTELDECLATDSLRLPYQLKLPGYNGFIPEAPINIKPKRVLFRRMEPWLSSTMVAQGVYKKR